MTFASKLGIEFQICMSLARRSGWPYSERIFVRVEVPEGEWPFAASFGPRNAARLPAYHRQEA